MNDNIANSPNPEFSFGCGSSEFYPNKMNIADNWSYIDDLLERQTEKSSMESIPLEIIQYKDFWKIWGNLTDDAKSYAARIIWENNKILDDSKDIEELERLHKKFCK